MPIESIRRCKHAAGKTEWRFRVGLFGRFTLGSLEQPERIEPV